MDSSRPTGRWVAICLLRALALQALLDDVLHALCGYAWASRYQVPVAATLASLLDVGALRGIAASGVCLQLAAWLAHRAPPRRPVVAWLAAVVLALAVWAQQAWSRTQTLVHGRCDGSAPLLHGPATVEIGAAGAEPRYVAQISAAGARGPAPVDGQWWLVGDSFTFGAGLQDHETVSSQLSAITGQQVANLGILGDNLAGEVARLQRWRRMLKPKGVLLLLMGNDGDVPMPWLDCEMPWPCRSRAWQASAALAPQPWLAGRPDGDPAHRATTRAQFESLVASLRNDGVFVGVLLYGMPSDSLREMVEGVGVDAYATTACGSPGLVFGGRQHVNPAGARCLADAFVHLRNQTSASGTSIRLNSLSPARCQATNARALADRLLSMSAWRPKRSELDPCLLELKPKVAGRPVEVRVHLGELGPSYLAVDGGTVEVADPRSLDVDGHHALQSQLQQAFTAPDVRR